MSQEQTTLICISCPKGCLMQVAKDGENVSVEGNDCPKGKTYAVQEMINPERVLTVLMRPEGSSKPVSVKTDRPVPKDMLLDCAAAIYEVHPSLPIEAGDVLIENLCGTGANVIATRSMKKQ